MPSCLKCLALRVRYSLALCWVGLCALPLCGAEDVGFENRLPSVPPWNLQGVVLSEFAGVKALDFHDQSTEEMSRIDYVIPLEQAAEMVEKGFTLTTRIFAIEQGPKGNNFSVTVRLPGLNPVYFVLEQPPSSGGVRCWTTNELTKETIRGNPNADGFVDFELVFTPGGDGNLDAGAVFLKANGRQIMETRATLNPTVGDKRVITLGGPIPERTGRTLVESLKLVVSFP